tara:strand:+ start:193 stop:558 length:366 start_codon:yes stop_codon:yes gene_type:complete
MIIKKRTRKFKVNFDLKISDRGDISLSENEMINLITKGKKNEIVAKKWGFYLTPSINKRLIHNGFRCAIIVNQKKKFFLTLVVNNKKSLKNFKSYLRKDKQKLVTYLSNKKLTELLSEKNN